MSAGPTAAQKGGSDKMVGLYPSGGGEGTAFPGDAGARTCEELMSSLSKHTLSISSSISAFSICPPPSPALLPSFYLRAGHKFIPYFPSRSGGKL